MIKLIKIETFALITIIFLFSVQTCAQSSSDTPFAYLYHSDFDNIILDGEIGVDEYPDLISLYDKAGSFVTDLFWGHNNSHLSVAIRSIGTGWVGLGLGDVGVSMGGSNIIMGTYAGGAVGEDMYSIKQGSPIEDESPYFSTETGIGLDLFAAAEVGGNTTFEFILPLTMDDPDGYDQNWAVNGTFGFFTAYHTKADDFGFEHTSHSNSLDVHILDSSFEPPSEIGLALTIIDLGSGSVNLEVDIASNPELVDVEDLEVAFYKKTLLGSLLIATQSLDASGHAEATIEEGRGGNVQYIVLFEGNPFLKRNQDVASVHLDIPEDHTTASFGDIRDLFGQEHLMRNFLIFWANVVVIMLLLIYAQTIADIFKLRRLGEEKTETKEVLS